jgi:type II secretory pathway predicted ATPase ExeA
MYTSYYGLRAKPFRLGLDSRFFFAGGPYARALTQLRYALSQGEGFIVVAGMAGTGKTLLIRSVCEELDGEGMRIAWLDARRTPERDFLAALLGVFGIVCGEREPAALMGQLAGFLGECAERGEKVLLIVDEAQNLSAEALEALRIGSNPPPAGGSVLQIVLAGCEGLYTTLQGAAMAPLHQRIVAICHLDPLGVEATRAYVEHRLGVVGWQGDPAFGEQTWPLIHRLARGVPGRINRVCDELLLQGFLKASHEISESAVRAAGDPLGTDPGAVPVQPELAAASLSAKESPSEGKPLASSPASQQRPMSASGPEQSFPDQQGRIDALEKQVADLETLVSRLRLGFEEMLKGRNRSADAEADDPTG